MAANLPPKNETIGKHRLHESDTGSPEVQIALLTSRISSLTEHAKDNKKDTHSRRGLVMLVSQRKKQLKFLRRTSPESYIKLTEELKIRRN